jgi:rod shape-determining protein MreC
MFRLSIDRKWAVVVIALLLCGLLTAARHQAQRAGFPDPITGAARRYLFVPTLSAVQRVKTWWRLDILSFFHGPRLAHQNSILRAHVAVLTQQNRVLAQQADENARLRALLAFKTHAPESLLAAEVIALKPFSERDSAIIARGMGDKVERKQVVLDPDGALVGQVTDVSSDTCDVLLLTDSLSSVGAEVVPVGRLAGPKATVGVCQGNRSATLTLTDLPPDADVRVGDKVVSSGLGGIFPKDLPIGRVSATHFDKTRYLMTATVVPDADFNHLQEAFLVQSGLSDVGEDSQQ